ncbi:MAG: hypothetical protein LBP24_03440 [Coriobacteriales bacterium]|nr:hypothetical protein [Coriobacteriales bacterium]
MFEVISCSSQLSKPVAAVAAVHLAAAAVTWWVASGCPAATVLIRIPLIPLVYDDSSTMLFPSYFKQVNRFVDQTVARRPVTQRRAFATMGADDPVSKEAV